MTPETEVNGIIYTFHIKRIVEEVYSVQAESKEDALKKDLEDPIRVTVIKETAHKLVDF